MNKIECHLRLAKQKEVLVEIKGLVENLQLHKKSMLQITVTPWVEVLIQMQEPQILHPLGKFLINRMLIITMGLQGQLNISIEYGSAEYNFSDGIGDDDMNDRQKHEREQVSYQGSTTEVQSRSRHGSESNAEDDQEVNTRKAEPRHKGESKEKYHGRALENKDGAVGQSPQEVRKMDKDKVKAAVENKVKAALEKRRKSQRDVTQKTDVMDDDDLIERELEDGIELAAGNEKNKRERKESWSKSSNRPEHENIHHTKFKDEAGDGHPQGSKWKSSRGEELDYVEEGELEPYDDADRGYRSPKSSSRKRKASSPSDKLVEGKQHECFPDDRNRPGMHDYSERDHKRHMQENHA